MLNSLKTMLAASLLALIGVWMGCSSDTSPVASYSASKSHTDSTGDAGTIPAAPTAPTDSVVTFPDANLARVIRAALGLDSTSVITAANMKSLRKLQNYGNPRISNLTGLQHAVNLDTLDLRHGDIVDLSPLADLTNLKYLELHDQEGIVDISPLAGLINLERLGIGRSENINLSRDIGVLAGLTKAKLKHFRINAFGLQNSGLKELAHNLTGLTHLNISKSGGITDYSPLTCLLPTLEVLFLRGMDHRNPPLYEIDADAPGDDLRVPSDNYPTLQYLKAKGVTIAWD